MGTENEPPSEKLFAALYWHTYFGTLGMAFLYVMYEIEQGRRPKRGRRAQG